MRPFLAFALLFAVVATARAQFAAERPAPYGGGQPAPVAAPTRPATQPSGIAPASASTPAPSLTPIPTTIDPNHQQVHPWAVKAEHGPWMICVKAYSGPNSKAMAEAFVKDIRSKNVAAFLFERNALERRAELAQIDAIRKQELEKNAPFLLQIEQERKKAQATGDVFLETKPKIKVPKPYQETQEQWAVLIGGFKEMEDAKKGLIACQAKLQPPPPESGLLDRIALGGQEKNQNNQDEWKSAANYMNPYKAALVVPNPAVSQAHRDDKGKLDPEVVEWNKDGVYSLLKAKKPWTLIVRSFTVPVKYVNKDSDAGTIFNRFNKLGEKNLYDVTAEEAVRLAAALSHPEMKPHPFKAFVLHHRSGSLVTVGEYDAADAPDLLKDQQTLIGITFKKTKGDKVTPVIGTDGRQEVQRMFDSVSPFPVPKY